MADYPTDRSYSTEHEWLLAGPTTARVGITAYAADTIGDVVHVTLPEVGSEVAAGEACGEFESTKAVNELYSPAAGVVTAVNEALADNPDLIGADPYGQGWLYDMELSGAPEGLLDAEAYAATIEG